MSDVTQCPQCSTRFRVMPEQLDAHEGMVRCGLCKAIFNAKEHLVNEEPSPQLSLPIMLEEPPQEPPPPATPSHEPIESAIPIEAIVFTEPAKAETATTLAQQVVIADEPHQPAHLPAASNRVWPWAIGNLLLLLLLLAQATYYFRVDLAAQLPGIKPALSAYCELLACSIPLPHKADLISIESSEMEAHPSTESTITLSAILRNRAPYAQAYPNLELTLTDAQDITIARRLIRPSEYLKPDVNETAGAPPLRETSIKLYLDTADLKPAGYRLFLFYP